MNWKPLTSVDQLNEIDLLSKDGDVLIFKHSTRCSTSAVTLDRLERKWDPDSVKTLTPYFLDLIANRSVSNEIAEKYRVIHESPQVLIIREGKCIYDVSHFGIDFHEIVQTINY